MAPLCYATDPALAIQRSLVHSLTRSRPESDRCWQPQLAAAAAARQQKWRNSIKAAVNQESLRLLGQLSCCEALWAARLLAHSLNGQAAEPNAVCRESGAEP